MNLSIKSLFSLFSYLFTPVLLFLEIFLLFRAVSVQDGMVVLDWKFDDVNGTYNTTHFEVGFLFSFKTNLMMMMRRRNIMVIMIMHGDDDDDDDDNDDAINVN